MQWDQEQKKTEIFITQIFFKSVQYNDQMQSLDCSQLASNYSLHMRKLMGKLQKQLEDEVITRTRKIESMLDK